MSVAENVAMSLRTTRAERDRYREALERIVSIGTSPRDTMLSMSGQFYERGQEMLDVATAALGETRREAPDQQN